MNPLTDIEDALPNGFHDAQLKRIEVDYERHVALFELDVLVSTPETEGEPEYRSARLTLGGLVFLSIDPPGSLVPSHHQRIDAGPGAPPGSTVQLPTLPAGAFLYWMYVDAWNGFIRFAAISAHLDWLT